MGSLAIVEGVGRFDAPRTFNFNLTILRVRLPRGVCPKERRLVYQINSMDCLGLRYILSESKWFFVILFSDKVDKKKDRRFVNDFIYEYIFYEYKKFE